MATCEKRHLLPSFAVTTATSFRKHLGGLDSGGVIHLLLLVVERPPEEHDVRLRAMDRIVHPTPALLHPDRPPLVLMHPPQITRSGQPQSKTTRKLIQDDRGNPRAQGRIWFTSERRRFLGSSLATSGGSTTCLRSRNSNREH